MRTTAIGLIIALPAIASSQLLGLWADRILSRLEHSLNYTNLWIEGVFSSNDSMSENIQHKIIKVNA